ncbi:hypothetical protein CC1G_08728 [Coprinopsis cinerea okayama7|uniref:Histone chaperone RTT106/FACT complex subunit SPT16-like middle domain-containing protein n=1 Tax=Coprinopsis cinerea (strain Okayama-7 / 130 / ATCC MYA-4618 / FGSC 9003) TaxID=240176 RepID=A8NIX9_COPC7|nr:hypothetical protein CC1G_08728 [Coprinopsis cinerea okayama7\|eukprot:XP_001834097.1 hypothetical protein CC1G_08728 [Coprinopsis cinerea okayama7\
MDSTGHPQYLQNLLPNLPEELATTVRALCSQPNTGSFLEEFLRFVVGAEPTPTASESLRKEWQSKQTIARGNILSLLGPSHSQPDGRKRGLNDQETGGDSSKRQRLSPGPEAAPDTPVFTLHSVSTTSPVRKKADITIGKTTITFKHATSGNLEATIPLSSIRRAFLLPTRGKSKAHWTIVLLSTDTVDTSKSTSANAQDSPQIIFGLDATTTAPLNTTTYTLDGAGEAKKASTPKGQPSLPSIRAFLSHLPKSVKFHEPSTDVFKSACNGIGSNASTTGIPGVEAYRAAKQGNLWFMKEGILWGENKPCEFWSVEDLINSVEGVRISPGSGRVFSLTLTRKVESDASKKSSAEEGDEEAEEGPEGVETELSMIDSRERDVVADWVRKHQNLFGRKAGDAPATAEEVKQQKAKMPQYTGPVTIHQLALESDSEDEDFEGSSSDDGSGSSGSDDSESDEEGSDDEEDAEGTDEEGGGGGNEDEDDDEIVELDPKHHPLLRPGAIPKMSKAAMDMAVGIVEDELMGGDSGPEEDELDDD